jgi:hypothetical protein
MIFTAYGRRRLCFEAYVGPVTGLLRHFGYARSLPHAQRYTLTSP